MGVVGSLGIRCHGTLIHVRALTFATLFSLPAIPRVPSVLRCSFYMSHIETILGTGLVTPHSGDARHVGAEAILLGISILPTLEIGYWCLHVLCTRVCLSILEKLGGMIRCETLSASPPSCARMAGRYGLWQSHDHGFARGIRCSLYTSDLFQPVLPLQRCDLDYE